ncbi:MAG: transposase [candidate division Zixibacteria bacterium]|nr:transposase [candidate division Zixibacteria bacterium]
MKPTEGERLVAKTYLPAEEVKSADRNVCATDSGSIEKKRRRLPHWTRRGSVYFITFQLVARRLEPDEVSMVLEHIRSGHGQFYTLLAACVMPDHVHLLLRPNDGISLSRITKGIKGVTARRINQSRGTQGRVWQVESWDRIVRNEVEMSEKLKYVLNNGAAAGLAEDPWQYQGLFINQEGSTRSPSEQP